MTNSKVLLIIEDDPGLQKQLKWSFEQYEVVIASNRDEAIAALRRHMPNVVTLDLGLPPDPTNASEGLATLKEILALAPATKIVVVTGNDDRANAIHAVALGAYDFYQKPVDPDVLGLIIERAFQLDALERDYQVLQQQKPLTGVIATSPQMQAVMRMIEKIAPTQATVLLIGESGTGKELMAKALHRLSARTAQPFVAVNCAAIPETLLESELFGYEKGAFTGAVAQTKGKIEYAQGGTFFLDEIGDLPFALQAKLLRFIQERVIERLGGRKEIPVDVRIICATHRHLPDLIAQGNFRGDLYYRLSEIVVDIPPLREREGDIITIANVLLQRYCRENNTKEKHFSHDAARALEAYNWPGNIREMENKIKRAVILSDSNFVTAEELEISTDNDKSMPLNLKSVREAAETIAIKRALTYADNNVSEAAKLLGVTRPTLYGLFEKYGLQTMIRNHIDEHSD
ncbi:MULTISPECIES: PEP-CTERM-box response regulator transcription factor [Methylomonas]|uniref:PEP-CTERM-box response regulator transcription factor n=2 Tax=Methylomonas TaxID=416 RepID=A0A126T2F2_9GAMM|nr:MULTISPECIES: PEP-CTERM-box response regulator transcription factor [Methylomonas]AMK75894.1 PEP-CTERM-box response regulator transcription factor [Methylomonas denitrificans]OAI01283.1 sigma-54-dependent Fis family transcriptional regulator [Methylomonas methanica]TCV79230.1 two-component system NtrC family response regulator [Methylomonas methanica]